MKNKLILVWRLMWSLLALPFLWVAATMAVVAAGPKWAKEWCYDAGIPWFK